MYLIDVICAGAKISDAHALFIRLRILLRFPVYTCGRRFFENAARVDIFNIFHISYNHYLMLVYRE